MKRYRLNVKRFIVNVGGLIIGIAILMFIEYMFIGSIIGGW